MYSIAMWSTIELLYRRQLKILILKSLERSYRHIPKQMATKAKLVLKVLSKGIIYFINNSQHISTYEHLTIYVGDLTNGHKFIFNKYIYTLMRELILCWNSDLNASSFVIKQNQKSYYIYFVLWLCSWNLSVWHRGFLLWVFLGRAGSGGRRGGCVISFFWCFTELLEN